MYANFGSIYYDNFYQINILIGLIMFVILVVLLSALVGHMREMVRLKYHISERAEFDETRVKIILAANFLLWLVYVAIWIFTYLTQNKASDFALQKSLFNMINVSLLIGLYSLFFMNNRIRRDIQKVKAQTPDAKIDKSQNIVHHI